MAKACKGKLLPAKLKRRHGLFAKAQYRHLRARQLGYLCAMHKNLVKLNLPDAPLKLARKNGQIVVWDNIRKKHLVLTPEEWVRQHFVHFLINRGYPATGIALEGGFQLHQKLQRSDILIYRQGSARLLVECKAPQVPVSQSTFDQASRYNLHYQVPYIAITNGLQHFVARVDSENKSYHFLKQLPAFDEL